MTSKHSPGPPLDLANMRRHGAHHFIAYCDDAGADPTFRAILPTPVLWSQSKVKCGKCGAHGRRIDVRPN
jgi:hypothetical protein